MNFEVSTPGKTILHGEHAVVYGKSAIAMSISLRTVANLCTHQEEKVTLNLKNLLITKEWSFDVLKNFCFHQGDQDLVAASDDIIQNIMNHFKINSDEVAIIAFLYLYLYLSKCYNSGSFVACNLEIDSQLGIGAGMGSSASYSVSLTTALLAAYGKITPNLSEHDKDLINKWAYETEKIFHGKPSGIDNSICTYGGALLFANGVIIDRLQNMPNINILLVDTKIPRNTKALVSQVKAKKEQYGEIINSVMNSIDEISKKSWNLMTEFQVNSVENGKLKLLQELVDMNQHLLNSLGIGHLKLDDIHRIAKHYNCSAKLTGAGGGGCAIVLLSEEVKSDNTLLSSLKNDLQECNFDVWDIFLGSSGVQIKSLQAEFL